jgi:hypothetical protein
MADRLTLLFVLVGCIAVVAAVAWVERRLRPRHALGARRLIVIGSIAVVVIELIILLLLAGTGDHFEPRCMQPQAVCSKNQ